MNPDSSVTRDDFRSLTPMADPEDIPPPDRIWSDADWELIQRGHASTDMDDKWNAYVEDQRLYLHRSWTGRGIYEAGFEPVPGGWRITAAVVPGDRASYRRLDDEYESALLEALIDGKLLSNYDGSGHQRLARASEQRLTVSGRWRGLVIRPKSSLGGGGGVEAGLTLAEIAAQVPPDARRKSCPSRFP